MLIHYSKPSLPRLLILLMYNMEWHQRNNKVFFEYLNKEIYFIVPDDFKLTQTHPDILKLIEILLLSPWHPEIINDSYSFTRNFGKKIGLGMSTGIDSTAAMLLLPPDTICSYLYRDFKSGIIHDNALRFIKENNNINIIKSNHELIRTNYGLMNGFSTDLACMVHLILLSDYFNLGYITCGTVLESAYLKNGYEYRDFNNSDYWNKWSCLFKKCGLNLVFPVAGLSEVLTTKIVSQSKYNKLAYSCLRKLDGCQNCYKCFRKNLLNGVKSPINKETITSLKKRPPKMASSIIYAMQKYNMDINILNEFKHLDLSFLDRFYDYSFDIMPVEISKHIKNNLNLCSIYKMNEDDIIKLKKLDLSEYS